MINCDKCQSCRYRYEEMQNLNPPPISNLFLGTTEACNLRCRYCFVHQNPAHMSYELAQKGLDFTANQQTGNFSIVFFGGEPLLRWDDLIVPLVKYGKEKYGDRVSFNMTSNCILIDEEKLEFMKNNTFDLLFSIDGAKETQDYNRPLPNGKSSFDVLEDKIPLILKYYPNMTFRMTVDNETVQHLYENHKFAVDQGYINTFACINQFANWTEAQYQTLKEQMYKVADLFIENVKNGKFLNFNPLISQFQKLKNAENSVEKVKDNGKGNNKCGIGANGSVVLGTDGRFFTCQETYTNPETRDFYFVGDIDNGIDNEKRKAIYSKFDPEKVHCIDENVKCEDCIGKLICDGGCLIRNYDLHRDFNTVSYAYCFEEKLLYSVCCYIRNELKDNDLFRKSVNF